MVSIVDSIWKIIRASRKSICTVLLPLNMFNAEIKSTEKFGPSSLMMREITIYHEVTEGLIVRLNDNLVFSSFKKMSPVK